MGLIEDYSKLLGSIQTISNELQDMKLRLPEQERALEAAKQMETAYRDEQAQRETALIQQQLATLTQEAVQSIENKRRGVQLKINELEARLEARKREIMADEFRKQLSGRYDLLDQMRAALAEHKIPGNIPEELASAVAQKLEATEIKYTDKILRQLCTDLHDSFDDLDGDILAAREAVSNKIISFILMQGITSSKISNKNRLLLYAVYLGVVVLGCLYFPILPVGLFGAISVMSYIQFSKENKALIDCIMPYSLLENGVHYLESQIGEKVEKFRADALAEVISKCEQDKQPLLQEQNQLIAEQQLVAERVRSSVSDEELKRRVAAEYEAKIQQCKADCKKISKEIAKIKSFIRSDEARLPELRERQKTMLLEIKEAYLNPSVPGKALTLTKSFFLGIDETQGTLIEFKFGGNTTLIVYKGSTCRTNKDLITMMLMQLLSSMSITVLDVYLTDQISAGTDYAAFFQKELSDKMHFCATEADIKNAIDELHEALILRTREILTEAPSLAEYNDVMLSRKSLPREYIFLFLQDPTDKLMQNQELQQILSNGPRVGIVPIIFSNHSYINGLSSQSGDSMQKIVAFFRSFHGSTFIYDGTSNDLTMSNDLDSVIVDMLEKGKRRRH